VAIKFPTNVFPSVDSTKYHKYKKVVYSDKFIYVTDRDEIYKRRKKAYEMLINTDKNYADVCK
jgi:bisphosphoglycerate-independent phosphoglycerate mutase (AlkP superfamily)